jgi:hypothetical protein
MKTLSSSAIITFSFGSCTNGDLVTSTSARTSGPVQDLELLTLASAGPSRYTTKKMCIAGIF